MVFKYPVVIRVHKSASLILGRPFLVTGRTLIDVEKWEVTLKVNEEKFILNAVMAMQHSDTPEQCMSIDLIDSLVEEVNMAAGLKERLNDILTDAQPDLKEPLETLKEKEKPPKLELKPLPSSLKYAFLEDGDTYPVIITSALEPQKEKALTIVLKTHRTALGWTISDLKGISPTRCMHKILLEDDAKPVVQPQSRLNPAMKEVV